MSAIWPAGIPHELDPPEVTVADLLEGMAVRYGTRAAVVDGELVLTHDEVYAQACALARGLRARGVGVGDVVVLHLPNSAWFLVAYQGVLLAGATVSPVNPLTPVPGLVAQLRDTGARTVVSHPAHLPSLRQAVADLSAAGEPVDTVVVVPPSPVAPDIGSDDAIDAAGPGGPSREVAWADVLDPGPRPATALSPDDLAHLVYTGGTTGVPKGVRVLHRNVVANLAQMIAWRAAHAIGPDPASGLRLVPFAGAAEAGVVPGEGATAVVSPLFHTHALVNSLFLQLCGQTLVLAGRFRPEGLLDLVAAHGVTYITGSPAMWHALLTVPDLAERDLGSVRVVSSGSAPIDPVTLDGLAGAFPNAVVLEGYGLTEGTCVVTAMPALRGQPARPGTVGLPLPGTTIEIRDRQGRALRTGERGEIWIRGPQVADGYHGRPEESAEQFVDGWLATGDVGQLDGEGLLRISDRAKDMLIYKGYNVYPRELEDLLVAHPDIDQAAVVGRAHPAVGQEPVAYVVPATGATPDPAAIAAWVAEQVLPYKKLREVTVVGALPTSPAGKILKTELRARADG